MNTQTYKIENNLIVGMIDGIDAVRQSVDKLLNTERFEYLIYSDDYGIELDSLIGENFDLVEAEIERVIKDALLMDDRIVDIANLTFEKTSSNSASITFSVETIFGPFDLEREWEINE